MEHGATSATSQRRTAPAEWQAVRPNPFPRSALASLIADICEPLRDLDDDDPDAIKRRCARHLREANARACVAGLSVRTLHILEDVVVHERRLHFMKGAVSEASRSADRHDIGEQRLAVGALAREFKIERREEDITSGPMFRSVDAPHGLCGWHDLQG